MSFLKKMFKKIASGFFYVVDTAEFISYMKYELNYSKEYNIPICDEINIYLGGKKHYLEIVDYGYEPEDGAKGIVFCYDGTEYLSLDEFYYACLNQVNGYFKIELTLGDSVYLNNYMAAHPELKVEDYE